MSGNRKKISGVFVFLFLCMCFGFVFFSCNPKSTGIIPSNSFQKIYDMSDIYSFTAIDIKQTMDGGYIILGEIGVPYLLKVDKNGDYMWDTIYYNVNLQNYGGPIPEILIIKQGQREEYYFFCNEKWNLRDEGSRLVVLLKASEDQNQPLEVKLPDGSDEAFENNFIFRPMHASTTTDTGILLIGSDEKSSENLVVHMKMDGSQEAPYMREKYFNPCITLYTFNSKRLHISGTFRSMGKDYIYFQSFSNELYGNMRYPICFGIRILALTDIKPFEIEFQKEPFFLRCPLIALELDGTEWNGRQWDGLKVSGVRIEDSVVIFYVNRKITDMDLGHGISQHELSDTKWVYIKGMNVNDKQVVFFVGTTKNNKIMLYAYNRLTGKFLHKDYFGDRRVYEASGLIGTSDGGLAILGTTYLAGRLGRICLFKLSKAELEDFVR
jgi:hypothetical protein